MKIAVEETTRQLIRSENNILLKIFKYEPSDVKKKLKHKNKLQHSIVNNTTCFWDDNIDP